MQNRKIRESAPQALKKIGYHFVKINRFSQEPMSVTYMHIFGNMFQKIQKTAGAPRGCKCMK